MLHYFLRDRWTDTQIITLGNIFYYCAILAAFAVAVVLIYRRFEALGYERRRVRWFLVLLGIAIFPSGYVSSRAANMFYYPPERWGFDFFIEQFLQGHFQTFHACLVLPIVIFGILIVSFRFRFSQVWDILFLHLPLAHAIARIGCLIAGCCWGRRYWFNLFGALHTFTNPVPLYELAMNTLLYLVLRRVFDKIHFNDANRAYSGAVTGLYFVGYGIIRLLLEPMRAEKVVALGLDQAQLAMPIFILFGVSVLFYVYAKHHAARRKR